MKFLTRTAILLTGLLVVIRAWAVEPESVLQVMLQGSSTAELTALVENVGGTITHDLHVINAVGAQLSQKQLDEVLGSPLVTRHLDDLASTDRPEEDLEEKEACKVRGHIELDFTPEGIQWGLYNKRTTPASMERLELSWPSDLGPVAAISVGDIALPPSLYNEAAAGSLTINFPSALRPQVQDIAALKVRFQSPTRDKNGPHFHQRDFMLTAAFVGGCDTNLVPGYENNHEDFYYNSVAGVDALHLQGVTGKGVTVAVVDSGLWEHAALMNDTSGKNRVLARYDALTDSEGREVVDESGHGTHMSSIIVHSGETKLNGLPTGSYKGVAPDANLVAVKVLDRQGLAHVLEIVRAIQWVVDNRDKHKIRILNLSFAQKPRWPYWEDPVNQAVMRAWNVGIVVVAAAGNEGPGQETIGSPGNVPYIITVGAVTDSWTPDTRDDDYIPDFSSRGPTPSGYVKPDVVALGGHMTGLIRPESAIALEQPEDMLRTGEFVSTGSSQASAFVSGMLALLLQLEPELSPDEIKCKLITSAEPAINEDGLLAYSPFQQGYGYVTATRAVLLGQKDCGTSGLDLRADLENQDHFYGPAIMEDDGSASLPELKNKVSAVPSEKGMSENRRWGVKDHIERLPAPPVDSPGLNAPPFDWGKLYLQEKAIIDGLSRSAPPEATSTR